MDAPQEKKVATLNELNHLITFSESLDYVFKNMDNPESISTVFCHLAILGEIVCRSNQPKLSESVYKLLPLKACQTIESIRSNYLSHAKYSTIINQNNIFKSLEGSKKEFQEFYKFSLRVILQQGSILICRKLDEIKATKEDQIGKKIRLFKEIDNLFCAINLPCFENEKFITCCKSVFEKLSKIFKVEAGKEVNKENANTLINSSEFLSEIDNLKYISSVITVTVQEVEINDFCKVFLSNLEYFEKEYKQKNSYTSPELEKENNSNILNLIKKRTEILFCIVNKFSSIGDEELKEAKIKKNTDILHLQYDMRWELIVINSLLEKSGGDGNAYKEVALLANIKNKIIHNFHKIDPVNEINDVTMLCKTELNKYTKLEIKERAAKKRNVEKTETVQEPMPKKIKLQNESKDPSGGSPNSPQQKK